MYDIRSFETDLSRKRSKRCGGSVMFSISSGHIPTTPFLHSLRKIPGPKLTAISTYLELYQEVITDGQYLWEVKKTHEKYALHQRHQNERFLVEQIVSGNGDPILSVEKVYLFLNQSLPYLCLE
ncbi:uncharacterized protein BDW43DRAFT_309835 [Aspergillus alliaceus]|uniref:uncharacterized protein n=1 Tax=Petromyces alliaceus TaxID=209559 RepID=UPI0012A5AA87|nr:uncharacterized protein BDW43DRAFT_309835 [Aspergillus alliaceus]KAB8235008.1 hypothetical protein BDW43DRAFT_309835 [Aspergillus alliaceus]